MNAQRQGVPGARAKTPNSTEARDESWRRRASDHYDVGSGRFFNPWKRTDRGAADLLKWWWTADRRPWPARIENRVYPPPPDEVGPGEAAVTFVGHASALVRLGQATVLTDPQFSTHAGAYGRWGVPRVRAPGLAKDRLPRLDVVFVSHNHYDHLDLASLAWLHEHRRPTIVAPLGVGAFLEANGIEGAVELDWWEPVSVGPVAVTLTPAQHWSNRTLLDRNATLWGGAYLRHEQGATAYFAGDSGYAPCFAEIRARLGAPGVALLPIGAYEPRWFMRDHHMNPDDAVRAHLDVGARTSIATHFGCFRLTDEGCDEPVAALARAREAHGLAPEAFLVLDAGETIVLPAIT
jgi:L-ascorbate metabolism protein UlaG (beta-lactamase superfamily)